ncbi:MAG: ParB/RepB/Spo0J family partition protein [Eubacteriales bacterium]
MEERDFFSTEELPKAVSDEPSFLMGGKIKAVVRMIKISEIFPDPEKPPKMYKTEELARLALDILENGLKNPISLIVSADGITPKYRIVSGEKRFRACLLARIDKIPCTIIYPEKRKERECSLCLSPKNYFEEAKMFEEAISRGIYTEESIAKSAGISKEEVKDILSLLVFSPEEQRMMIDAEIPEKTARELSSFDANTRRGFLDSISCGTDVAAVCAKIEETALSYRSPSRRQKKKIMIRGTGFFFNSVNHAVDTMREGGVDIKCSTEETCTSTIMTLTVPKEEGNVPRGTSK